MNTDKFRNLKQCLLLTFDDEMIFSGKTIFISKEHKFGMYFDNLGLNDECLLQNNDIINTNHPSPPHAPLGITTTSLHRSVWVL